MAMAFGGHLPNCLTCGKELEDQKPLFLSGDSEEEERNEQLSEFRESFQCFCRWMNVINGEDRVNSVLDEALGVLTPSLLLRGSVGIGRSCRLPCCMECCDALTAILNLERRISEMKATQMDHVKALKTALLSVDDCHSDEFAWAEIRKQLIGVILKRPRPNPLTSKSQPSQQSVQSSSQLQQSSKIIPNILRRKTSRNRKDNNLTSSNDLLGVEAAYKCTTATDINSSISTRQKRKRRHQVIQETQESSQRRNQNVGMGMGGAVSNSVRPCSVVLERLSVPNAAPPTNQENTRPKLFTTSTSTKKNPSSTSSQTASRGYIPFRKSQYGRLFSKISENLLLYKFTLIKVSRGGTQFSCMETGCTSMFRDPNSYFLFQKIQNHIDMNHLPQKNQVVIRKCPLPDCQQEFSGGRGHQSFRSHLVSAQGHSLDSVVCESCWKPVRNLADNFRFHVWSHKDEREQAETEGGPPVKIRKKMEKKGMKPWTEIHKSENVAVAQDINPTKKTTHSLVAPTRIAPQPFATENENESPPKLEPDDGEMITPPRSPGEPDMFHEHDPDSDPDFVPSTAASEEEVDDDGDDIDYVPELRTVPKTIKRLEKSPGKSLGPANKVKKNGSASRPRKLLGLRPNHMIWQVNDQTLLYKYTLVQVFCSGTYLKCLEESCHFFVHDPDYFNLFEEMKEHIDTMHPTRSPTSKNVKCPHRECQSTCVGGANLRSHLAKIHILEVVFCEICWKPIRNLADNYRLHKWSHKNAQEKAETEGGPPKQVIYKAALRKTPETNLLTAKAPNRCTGTRKKSKAMQKMTDKPKKKVDKPITKKNERLKQSELQNDHFLQLQDNILLYKYTAIKISSEQELICQEPDCSSGIITNGIDYFALQNVKDHVNNCHLNLTSDLDDYFSTSRQCPMCENSEVFQDGSAFRRHFFLTDHAPCPYICQSCWRPMTKKKMMDHHVSTHQKFKEKLESSSGGDAGDIDIPSGPKEDSSKFICSHCGREFDFYANLYNHEFTHLPKHLRKKYNCPHCPAMLLSKVAVRNHVERLHRPDLRKFRNCPICNKQYNWRDGHKFQVHMRMHRNEFPFVCDICGKGFRSTTQFRVHQNKAHSEERMYQCEYCEMNYKYPNNLKRHMMSAHKDKVPKIDPEEKLKFTHYEYRPDFIGPKIAYPCEFCEKVFPMRSRMTKHVKLVHGDQSW